MQRPWIVCSVLATCLMLGCSSSEPEAPQASKQSALQPAKPEQAVFQFLEAVRTGNDEAASAMLSELARKKTSEMDLVVAPPGSETASFKVSEVEMLSADTAHVASTWTEINEQGMPEDDLIVWMLRREPVGWRITGMAVKAYAQNQPIILDFEKPEEMLRQQQMAEQQSQAQQPAAEQARQSEAATTR